MNSRHSFNHEVRWHWVVGGLVLLVAIWELSESSLVEDASAEDAARVAGELAT
jgi:hypothetical protein